jgi:hypothetical protein
MCYRIAATMADGDAAKRAIIDKLLAATPEPERPEPVDAKGLVALAAGGS